MPDMTAVLACLRQCLAPTTLRRLRRLTEAMLALTGRVTMRGMARWAGPGGSYRTVHRVFNTSISGGRLQWMGMRHHLWDQDEVIVMAGDDVVVTKAGKQPHGLGRFFSSLSGKKVPGLGFLSLSLLRVKRRTSYPVMMEQRAQQYTEPPQAVSQPKSRGKRGRPHGSKNQHRRDVVLSPYLRFVQETIKRLLELMGAHWQVMYLVFDGACGHHDALQMVRPLRLPLISQLRHDAALYFSDEGPYAGRGQRKKSGKKLAYRHIDAQYLQESSIEKGLETKISPMALGPNKFADLLNIVVIMKTKLPTQAVAHIVLFSSDLELPYHHWIDYYRLRFQLEFNFRDANPYGGLEEFMTVNETPVYHSANLAMFLVHVSQALMRPMHTYGPELSVNDLQAWCRSKKYVVATFKMLPEMPEPSFIDQAIAHVARLGRVNQVVNPF